FMVAKKSSREMSQPIIDFFNSEEVGRVFSANGKFPSTNKMIDNGLSEEQNFKWVGWDFIRSNDIGALIEEIEKVFNESIAS
ncbi:MAG: ABC transporter substrate-binding protein, partial [Peptostreptococcus porci]|nr:ABC transporter substrate-binding protein [Peptostreptococcus porci]